MTIDPQGECSIILRWLLLKYWISDLLDWTRLPLQK
jgi:hypothetical protein